ncbi:MAG: hypothetical protein AAF466_08155 [Bacteroidota bacterium]
MKITRNHIHPEIIPFVGFDRIRLGQTLGQVELLLGKPSEIQKELFHDNSLDIIWKYHEVGVDLTFSGDDQFVLGSVTFYSKDFLLNGLRLIGLPEVEFLRLGKTVFPDLEMDDDFEELNAKDYLSNSNGLTFWIQDGVLENITVFPNYQEDNDTPIWPVESRG